MGFDSKFWRTLVRVEHIQNDQAEAVVLGWDVHQRVRFDLSDVDNLDVLKAFETKPFPVRVFAKVNIGSQNADELIFKDFEVAPEPDLSTLT